jgi:hypothetical protein
LEATHKDILLIDSVVHEGLYAEAQESWLRQLPLELAFWAYAVIYGFALNVAATGAAFALIRSPTRH